MMAMNVLLIVQSSVALKKCTVEEGWIGMDVLSQICACQQKDQWEMMALNALTLVQLNVAKMI